MSQTPAASSLPRVLGGIAATALVVGTVLGSGIFRKPFAIATAVPYSGVVALLWIVAGLLVFLGALALAEVASVLPRTGGNYVFLRESYGQIWGFLWGWVDFWIIRSASIAALGTAFSDALANQLGGTAINAWGRMGLTIGVIVFLAWVNIRGVRWGSGLQVVITTVKIGSLLLILALPWIWLLRADPGPVSSTNLNPIWPDSWTDLKLGGLGTAFLSILWAYHGWGNIAPASGEITRPQRNIPLALLSGVLIVVALYLSVNLAYYLIMNADEMQKVTGGRTVAEIACGKLLGNVGLTFAAVAIMFSTFGALNGNILVGPRLLFAMGEDSLAPKGLSHIHPRYKTPDRAIALLSVWACLLVLGAGILLETGVLDKKTDPFDRLTNFAMFGSITFETLGVVAIFVLRWKMPNVERPYKCPGYPWVPALYVLLPAYVLASMVIEHPFETLAGSNIILAGVIVYFVLGLHRVKPAPAGESP
jgi:amino acid transporter